MRTLNGKISGKAGRKRCVNVSRSVSVCQSDPLALPKPPGGDRQAGCFLEKWLLNCHGWPLFQGHVQQFSTVWKRTDGSKQPLLSAEKLHNKMSENDGVTSLNPPHTRTWWYYMTTKASPVRLCRLLTHCIIQHITPLLACNVQNKGVKNSPHESY